MGRFTKKESTIDELNRMVADLKEKYPRAMNRWYDNWDALTPIFKFSADVRTLIYTTNSIESLNAIYRKLNRQRSVFPSDQALLKALYLSTFEATKNGPCLSETGVRSMVNFKSCMKEDFLHNKKSL